MTSKPALLDGDCRSLISRKFNKLLGGTTEPKTLPPKTPSGCSFINLSSSSLLSQQTTPADFTSSHFIPSTSTKSLETRPSSSTLSLATSSLKSSKRHGSSKSNATDGPNTSTISLKSRTSNSMSKSKHSRPPSPPSMYSSFGFVGPIKKPPPLYLDPKKQRPKLQSKDSDVQRVKSKKGKGVQPIVGKVFVFPAKSSGESIETTNRGPLANIATIFPPEILVHSAAQRHAPSGGTSSIPTATDSQNIAGPEPSDSTGGSETPVTPRRRVFSDNQLRRNFEKLTRTLGENVPAELVFRPSRGRETKDDEEVDWQLVCKPVAKSISPTSPSLSASSCFTDFESVATLFPTVSRPRSATVNDVTPPTSASNTVPNLVISLSCLDQKCRTSEEPQRASKNPRLPASIRPSTSAGCATTTTEMEISPVESHHVRGMSDQMTFAKVGPRLEPATRSVSTITRPKTSHGSPTSPYSPAPFAPYRQNTSFVPTDLTTSAVQRIETEEGWSGEWNQNRMQDVIRKLRVLK